MASWTGQCWSRCKPVIGVCVTKTAIHLTSLVLTVHKSIACFLVALHTSSLQSVCLGWICFPNSLQSASLGWICFPNSLQSASLGWICFPNSLQSASVGWICFPNSLQSASVGWICFPNSLQSASLGWICFPNSLQSASLGWICFPNSLQSASVGWICFPSSLQSASLGWICFPSSLQSASLGWICFPSSLQSASLGWICFPWSLPLKVNRPLTIRKLRFYENIHLGLSSFHTNLEDVNCLVQVVVDLPHSRWIDPLQLENWGCMRAFILVYPVSSLIWRMWTALSKWWLISHTQGEQTPYN